MSFELVDFLVFSDGLLSKIKKMLKILPEDYASIYIRNTDFKANDLNNFFKRYIQYHRFRERFNL